MSLAIKIKQSDGTWFLLADGIHARPGIVDSWIELAKDIFPGSEIRIVEEPAIPEPESATRH